MLFKEIYMSPFDNDDFNDNDSSAFREKINENDRSEANKRDVNKKLLNE